MRNLLTKRVMWFMLAHGILPRQRWFSNLVICHLFVPISPAIKGQPDGFIDLGPTVVSPQMVRNIQRWWEWAGRTAL